MTRNAAFWLMLLVLLLIAAARGQVELSEPSEDLTDTLHNGTVIQPDTIIVPDDTLNAYLEIYEHLRMTGELRAAEQQLWKTIRLAPLSVRPYIHLSDLYCYRGDREQGLLYLYTALTLANNDEQRAVISNKIACCLELADDPATALRYRLNAHRLSDGTLARTTVDSLLNHASGADSTARLDSLRAYWDLEQLKEDLQVVEDYLLDTYHILIENQNYGAALMAAEKLSELDQDWVPFQLLTAEALAGMNRIPEAIARVEPLPEVEEKWLLMARLNAAQDSLDQALGYYDRVLENYPDRVNILLEIADLYLDESHPDSARGWYRRACDLGDLPACETADSLDQLIREQTR